MVEIRYTAFPRPRTVFNRFLSCLLDTGPVRHAVTLDRIFKWRMGSVVSFARFTADHTALGRVISSDIEWILEEHADPPEGVWFGEVQFAQEHTVPRVVIYAKSICARLPTFLVFNLAGQSGMDHLIGHLYPFLSNALDYDEAVACRYQFRSALHRWSPSWIGVATLVIILEWLHKRIPLRTYFKPV